MRRLHLTLLIIAIAGLAHGSASAQTKFDSYGRLGTDDEAARLDLFHNELSEHPDTRGYVVGYNDSLTPQGVFLRRLYGDQTYLTEMRGLEPARISVIEGGYRDKFTIELWMVPLNTPAPIPSPRANGVSFPTKRFLFDDECLECSPAVFLDLPGLGTGLKFYAAALHKSSDARALLIVRPGQDTTPRQALKAGRRAKQALTRQYGIPARRIEIRLARRRQDNVAAAEMWIIPRALK